jgi:hypothetical protein
MPRNIEYTYIDEIATFDVPEAEIQSVPVPSRVKTMIVPRTGVYLIRYDDRERYNCSLREGDSIDLHDNIRSIWSVDFDDYIYRREPKPKQDVNIVNLMSLKKNKSYSFSKTIIEKSNTSEKDENVLNKIAEQIVNFRKTKYIENAMKREISQIRYLRKASSNIKLKLNRGNYKSEKLMSLKEYNNKSKARIYDSLKRNIKSQIKRDREKVKRLNEYGQSSDNYSYRLQGTCDKRGRYSGVFKKSGSILELFKNKMIGNINSKTYYPKTPHNHIGIEFEFFSSMNRNDILEELFKNKFYENVRIKNDTSIQPNDENKYGWEICLLVKQDDYKDTLKKICDFLYSIDAEVNDTCGLHVHLDMRNRNAAKCFKNLTSVQSILYKMNPICRKKTKYSKPLDNLKFIKRQEKDKYFGINTSSLKRFNTLEVRMHYGTINAKDISNWIEFLISIVDSNEVKNIVNDSKEFFKWVKLNKDLTKYVNSKIKTYKKEHVA